MKKGCLIFVVLAFFPAVLFVPISRSMVFAENVLFTKQMGVGYRGEEVVELQKFLNSDSDTQVASFGPGSPGQETSFYGSLTRLAVNKFQKKYSKDVLYTNQLPTGFVGPKTLAKINFLLKEKASTPISSGVNQILKKQTENTPAPQTFQAPQVSDSSTPTPEGNPNYVNLGQFVADVSLVGKKKGYSSDDLKEVVGGIMTAVATTTDLRKEFAKARSKARKVTTLSGSSFYDLSPTNLFREVLTSLGVLPKVAEANAGGLAFGGEVYFVFFCTCTGNWLVDLQPLPPHYPVLLTYYEGTQEYLNYNAPFTSELLGFYNNGGQCREYIVEDCIELPSEGEISGTLGSSI